MSCPNDEVDQESLGVFKGERPESSSVTPSREVLEDPSTVEGSSHHQSASTITPASESALLVLKRRQHSPEAEGEGMKEEEREKKDEGEGERGEEEGEEEIVIVSEKALVKKGKETAAKGSPSKKVKKPQLRIVATPIKPMVDGEANAIWSLLP